MTEIGSFDLLETQSLVRKDKHVKKQLYHSVWYPEEDYICI